MATREEVAAAEAYGGLHVEELSSEWVPRAADGVAIGSGSTVLDIACGIGVPT